MKKIVLLAVLAAGSVQAAEEINVYSARQAYLIEPIVKEFEKDQGRFLFVPHPELKEQEWCGFTP